MNKNITNILSWIFAIQFIIFGANKLYPFLPMEPSTDPVIQSFFGAMFGTYLGKLVGLTETLAGLLIFMPKMRFLGLLIIAPVMVNILCFHLFHDLTSNFIWVVVIIIYLIVCYPFKNRFMALMSSNES